MSKVWPRLRRKGQTIQWLDDTDPKRLVYRDIVEVQPDAPDVIIRPTTGTGTGQSSATSGFEPPFCCDDD